MDRDLEPPDRKELEEVIFNLKITKPQKSTILLARSLKVGEIYCLERSMSLSEKRGKRNKSPKNCKQPL